MLDYVFEPITAGKSFYKYQVRLDGVFVCYTDVKSPEFVDNILRQNGFDSRQDFLNEHNQHLNQYFGGK